MKLPCRLFGFALLCIASMLISRAETTYTMVDFSQRSVPGLILGGEFPGAQATAEWVPASADAPAFARMHYDFTKGGKYTQFSLDGFLATGITKIEATVRGSGHPAVLARVVDGKGEVFQLRKEIAADAWQTVVLPLNPAMDGWYNWGGDKQFDQPTTAIFLGIDATDSTGTFDISKITITTTENQEDLNTPMRDFMLKRLNFSTAMPGNLFFPADTKTGMIAVANAPSTAPAITIMPMVVDIDGKAEEALPTVTLNAQNKFTVELPLPTAMGYYQITLAVDGAPGVRSSFAVVPENHTPDRYVASPFGVNTHFNQGWDSAFAAIVKRAGIGWIRDGEASLDDKAILAAQANKLCYLPCFTWYRKPLAEKNRRADGSWDFSDIAEQYRQYAQKYGSDVDVYDLVNEPHGEWASVFGGSWDGGAWVPPFTTTFGKQVTAAIKAGDPGAKVMWEDIDRMLWYKQFYAADPQCQADILSPHTYSLHRGNPLPETQPVLETMPEFLAFTRQRNLPWRVWVGEVGFSSYVMDQANPPTFYSPMSEAQQAQLLVRMMVVQLASGIDKIFWYDLRNDGFDQHNPEHNFGLLLNDGAPKPSIVAYANIIHKLSGGVGSWLGRVGTTGDVYAFRPATTGKPVVIAWSRSGQLPVTLNVPSGAKSVTLSDIYGRLSNIPTQGNRLQLMLTESPIYIGGLTVADLQANTAR